MPPLFHQFLQGVHQLVDYLIVSFPDIIYNAGVDMAGKKGAAEAVESSGNGGCLYQYIRAVGIFSTMLLMPRTCPSIRFKRCIRSLYSFSERSFVLWQLHAAGFFASI